MKANSDAHMLLNDIWGDKCVFMVADRMNQWRKKSELEYRIWNEWSCNDANSCIYIGLPVLFNNCTLISVAYTFIVFYRSFAALFLYILFMHE